MDPQTVSQFITSLGFPIFVAVWMLWKSDEQEKKTQEILTDNKIAITKLTDAVNNMTIQMKDKTNET